MNLGPLELLILLPVVLLVLAIPIWAIVDAAQRPDFQWAAAGQNKTTWLVLLIVGTFFCGLGLVLGLVYLLSIRPKLQAEGGYA